jgi:hypothetical protein
MAIVASISCGFYSTEGFTSPYHSDPARVAKLQHTQQHHSIHKATRPDRVAACAEWAKQLAACYTKSESYSLQLAAQQHNTGNSLRAVCPFTGLLYTLDLGGAHLGHSLPRSLVVAVHPMLSTQLSSAVEDSLSLHWQLWRTLATLASLGVFHCTVPLTLPATLRGLSLHRLTIAQEKLLELSYATPQQLADVPQYHHTQDTDIDSLCIWAVAAHSKLMTGTTDTLGTDDLDAMLDSEQRKAAHAERLEAQAVKASRVAAQRKLGNINLRASIDKVCAIMEDLPSSGWTAELHSARLQRIARAETGIDLGWLTVLSDLIQDSYPDAHFVGLDTYACMLLVMQRIDTLTLNALNTLADLCDDSLDSKAEAIQAKVRARYTMQGTEAALETYDIDSKLTVAHNVSNSKTAQTTAKALNKALRDNTASIAVQPTDSPNSNLSIAERIALARAKANVAKGA